jgi:hypothetical protein
MLGWCKWLFSTVTVVVVEQRSKDGKLELSTISQDTGSPVRALLGHKVTQGLSVLSLVLAFSAIVVGHSL